MGKLVDKAGDILSSKLEGSGSDKRGGSGRDY
jgi:hypothetical protein